MGNRGNTKPIYTIQDKIAKVREYQRERSEYREDLTNLLSQSLLLSGRDQQGRTEPEG